MQIFDFILLKFVTCSENIDFEMFSAQHSTAESKK